MKDIEAGTKSSLSKEEALREKARGAWYRALAAAIRDPHLDAPNVLDADETWPLLEASAALLRSAPSAEAIELASGELPPDQFDPADLQRFWKVGPGPRAAFFDRVFGFVTSKDCPPHETDYCPQTFSVHRSNQIADIAGFYKAFGLEPSRKCRERADHIAPELEFMAWLIAQHGRAVAAHGPDSDQAIVTREAQTRFLGDHLAWWAPAFACALRRRADDLPDQASIAAPPSSHLGAFGRLLVSFIALERSYLGVPLPQELVQPLETDEAPSACGECEGS